MALYGVKLWWCKQKGWCEGYEKLVNRQRRVVKGMLRFVSMGVAVHKAVPHPAISLMNNRQRRYNLGLLAAPRIQPISNILQVTLGAVEKHVLPGELPEDDNV